ERSAAAIVLDLGGGDSQHPLGRTGHRKQENRGQQARELGQLQRCRGSDGRQLPHPLCKILVSAQRRARIGGGGVCQLHEFFQGQALRVQSQGSAGAAVQAQGFRPSRGDQQIRRLGLCVLAQGREGLMVGIFHG